MSSSTIDLELHPGRDLKSDMDPRQQAAVHRTDDTVVLELSPVLAEILAQVLVQHQASRAIYAPFSDDYDLDLWSHLVVDLLAAKARLGHVDVPTVDVALSSIGGEH